MSNSTNKIKEAKKSWLNNTLNKIKRKFPERKSTFLTSSNLIKKTIYTPLEIDEGSYLENIGFPGEYPFTRGIQPNMFRGKIWTMRQYAGFATAEESNKRYLSLLEKGQTGLSVAFDLPTQIGYDSDNEISYGEVGKVGVAIDTVDDMELLFKNIPLDKISTSMTINAPAAILLAMYVVIAENRGISADKLSGTIQNDILKEYIARGTYIFPPEQSMRLITDVMNYCSENIPKWNTISISGYHIREAGSTAAQEIGFTLANGISYVETALKAGLDIDNFANRLSFFFNVHNDIFEEVAKFRCARRMWAKIMKERFNAKNESSLKLRFHTQTGGSTLTAQQPLNNIVRVALQGFASVSGGTQSLHTNSFDEALALPSDLSSQIALRTQQIIANESGSADVVDPFGGSYYIEALTDALELKSNEYIDKIDSLGGVINAIQNGYIQREIQNSAYQYQKEIESNERTIVGLNDFKTEEEPMKNLLKIDMKVQENQVNKLKIYKENRDLNSLNVSLEKLTNAAKTTENLMPYIISSLKSKATIGEICDKLRAVFGEHVNDTFI